MSIKPVVIPPLLLRKVQVSDFRCHHNYSVEFSSGINLICGHNGSGKTSLLEAIHLMACGSSFRRSRIRDLVRWQQPRYLVRGNWHRYGVINVKASGDRSTTMIALQGRQISVQRDLQEHLALVVDSPQSERLIDGGPRIRRRWMDRLLLALIPSTGQYLHHYNRAMLQRSRLVRQGASVLQVAPWNAQMVVAGRAWVLARQQLVKNINHQLEKEQWVDANLSLSITNSASDDDDQWLKKLECLTHPLRVGPQCDTITLLRNNREVLLHSSHGQQKVMVVALRLVESLLRAEKRYLYPILLLDDCFEALDRRWQQQMVARLQDYPGQVILTAPDDVMFKDDRRQECNRLIRLSSLESIAEQSEDGSVEEMLNGTGY